MARPFGSTFQTLPALRGLSSPFGRQDDLAPFQPTDEDILRQQEDLEQGSTPLFFKILQLPDRAFFGQSIKGLLAGTGEPGIQDNLEEFFRKNPLFQLIDGVFGTDLTGEDVAFTDVRRELFGDTGDVQSGAGNFLINILGEVITDPASFILPFGLTKAGRLKQPIGGRPGPFLRREVGLAKQVEAGTRAMFVWKIPFREKDLLGLPARWEVPVPKSLNIGAARKLEGVANALNKTPLVAGAMRAFDRASGRGLDATGRFAVRGSEAAGALEKRQFLQPFEITMGRMINDSPEVLRDPDLGKFVYTATELGLSRADEIGSIPRIIREGMPARVAELRLKKLLNESPEAKILYGQAKGGSVEALKDFRIKYPDIPLPEELLRHADIRPVPGLDIPPAEAVPLDTGILPTQRGITGDDISSAGQRQRAEIVEEVGDASAETIAASREASVDLFERIRTTHGDEKIRALIDLKERGVAMMEQVALSDIGSGFISKTSELYIPREVGQKALDMINDHWDTHMRSNVGAFKGQQKHVANFMKGRKFDKLTTAEAESIMYDLGSNFTGGKPFKEFEKSAYDGILSGFAKVFDEKFIKKMKKAGFRDAAQLFEANPFLSWHKRILRSSNLRQASARMRFIFNRRAWDAGESPWISHVTKGGDAKNAELALDHKGYYTVDQVGEAFSTQGVPAGTAFADGFGAEAAAKTGMARANLEDDIAAAITREEALVGGMSKDEVIKQIEDARLLNKDSALNDLNIQDVDTLTVRSLKRFIERRKTIQIEADDLAKSGDEAGALAAKGELGWLDTKIGAMRGALNIKTSDIAEARKALIEAATKTAKQTGSPKFRRITELANQKLSTAEYTNAVEAFRRVKEKGVLAFDEMQETFGADLGARMQSKLADGDVFWMEKQTAKGILGAIDSLSKPDVMGRALGFLDRATWFWKAWTVLPAFAIQTRMRDFMTNMILLSQGGMSPTSLLRGSVQSWKINKAFSKAMKTDNDDVMWSTMLNAPDGRQISVGEFLQKVQGRGLMDSSWVRDEVYRNGLEAAGSKAKSADPILQKLFDPRPERNIITRKGFQFAEFGDNQAKIMGVLSRWVDGEDIVDAIENTRPWVYDPSKGMTNFERYGLRRVIPFYSWLRFAVRTEVDAFFKKPGTVTAWEKMWAVANDSVGVEDVDYDKLVPEWIRDALGVPFQKDDKGNPEFFILGNYVPLGEVAQLVNAIANTANPESKEGLTQFVGERLNPYARTLIEGATNKSFFTQRAIADFPGDTDEWLGKTMPKFWRSVVYNIRAAAEFDRLNVFHFGDFFELLSQGRVVDAAKSVFRSVPRGPEVGGPEQLPLLPDLDEGAGSLFSNRLLTGTIGPFPRVRKVDIERRTRTAEVETQLEESKYRALIRRRAKHPDRIGNEEDIEALQELWARNKARQAQIEKQRRRFNLIR